MTNPIRQWREAARRRQAERDVRVHPDAGTLPSRHSHRAPAHGARDALTRIDAELAPTEAAAAGPVYAPGTVRWARAEIERNAGDAADLHIRAMECLELERELLERNTDLRGFLRCADPAEFTPGVHQAPAAAAVDQDRPAGQPTKMDGVGACANCGTSAGTRWAYYGGVKRLVPVCKPCVATMPLPDDSAPWPQQESGPQPGDVRAMPAVSPQAMSDGPAGPWTAAATQEATSPWWMRPAVLASGDVEESLAELAALDGAL